MNKKVLKSVLLFGEGKNEYTFFNFLLRTDKFKFLENEWSINTGHASGSSCKDVLLQCIKETSNNNIVLCFIDTDKLKHDFPKNSSEEKQKLEVLAKTHNIEIVWQEQNLEEILTRATQGKISGKGRLKQRLENYKVLILRCNEVKSIFNRIKNF